MTPDPYTSLIRREIRMLRYLFCAFGLLLLCLVCLTGCVSASGTGWKITSVATDSSRLVISAKGLDVRDLNQSKAFTGILTEARKAWSSYLLSVGMRYVAGKYYDHQGRLTDAATTTQLESLRNAKSAADSAAALDQLKITSAIPSP